MFPDYVKLVLEDYHRKIRQNMLPSGLVHSTRAKLKKQCLLLCKGGLQPKDEKVIRDFCERWDNTKNCWQNIGKCDADKFRPLDNFIKGESDSTDHKNIELLAWLIDFPDRPFDFTKEYIPIMEVEIEAAVQDEEDGIPVNSPHLSHIQEIFDRTKNNPETNGDMNRTAGFGGLIRSFNVDREKLLPIQVVNKKRRFRNIVIVGALLTILGTGGYWWLDKPGVIDITMGEGGCMYWAGDHYQPTPCNKKIPNVLVVALDPEKIKNFKKIMRPDTITNRAIGYVWYSKINNRLEFFTAEGDHPVVIDRHLKPISDHIIATYIHPGMTVN